jgi:hypothetical protein
VWQHTPLRCHGSPLRSSSSTGKRSLQPHRKTLHSHSSSSRLRRVAAAAAAEVTMRAASSRRSSQQHRSCRRRSKRAQGSRMHRCQQSGRPGQTLWLDMRLRLRRRHQRRCLQSQRRPHQPLHRHSDSAAPAAALRRTLTPLAAPALRQMQLKGKKRAGRRCTFRSMLLGTRSYSM